MRRGGLIGTPYKYVRDRQEAKRAALEAEEARKQREHEERYRQQEMFAERREQARREKMEANSPSIDTLRDYAGKLVVMSNPQGALWPGNPATPKFIDAMSDIFVGQSRVGVSFHASAKRMREGIESDLRQVPELLEVQLAYSGTRLVMAERGRDNPGVYVTNGDELLAKLGEAVEDSRRNGATGHLAVVSAFGMPGVDLSYNQGRWGNAYLLNGIDEDYRFDWQPVFHTLRESSMPDASA
jgi:hypothetical protein